MAAKRTYILTVFVILSVLTAVYCGQVRLFPLTDITTDLLWDFRLPRVMFALLNGAMLTLAGVLYQIVLRNPMADGFTTGAASSAAFGGCLALVLWGNPILVTASALVFATLGTAFVRSISSRAGGFSPVTVILAGIALSVIAGSGVSFLKYFFNDSISTMVFWLMGGLQGATWGKVTILLLILCSTFIYLIYNRHQISLLFLDDRSASSSGVDVYILRQKLFFITTLLVGVSVSFCGVIGFIGLMIPHMSRAIFGHDILSQLVCTPLLGAGCLVLFDLVARTALGGGGELPVGVMTSMVGGVFFCLLLMRRGGEVW